MRLRRVASGHSLEHKLLLAIIRWRNGDTPSDVLRTLRYRPQLYGRPFSEWLQAVLRGPSRWTVGERELFAAWTSRLNQCVF